MEPVFAYTDYRQFLRDYFEYQKKTHRYFSFRTFADRAGFKARDYILRVMNGQRNLSHSGIFMLSQAMGFSEKEADYFSNLVGFNQAKTIKEKEHCYRKMGLAQRFGKHQKLRDDQFEYLSQWYYAAIRSALPVIRFGDDYEKLGRFLDPPITARQAREAVQVLVRLGLIERGPGGTWRVTNPELSTGDELKSVALASLHRSLTDLAKASIDKHRSCARDISGVTLSISKEAFARIKGEISSFRKHIMNIASNDTNEDRIYQLGIHFFPLSQVKE